MWNCSKRGNLRFFFFFLVRWGRLYGRKLESCNCIALSSWVSMATDGKVSHWRFLCVHVGVCLPVSAYLGVFVTTRTDAHQCIFHINFRYMWDMTTLHQISIRAFFIRALL